MTAMPYSTDLNGFKQKIYDNVQEDAKALHRVEQLLHKRHSEEISSTEKKYIERIDELTKEKHEMQELLGDTVEQLERMKALLKKVGAVEAMEHGESLSGKLSAAILKYNANDSSSSAMQSPREKQSSDNARIRQLEEEKQLLGCKLIRQTMRAQELILLNTHLLNFVQSGNERMYGVLKEM
eukprot:TRINITY_DN1332_c0_g1_i1.p1 TRINITY_DN1332_c0_g1~~TRINITY_DN1332_c0_g1_i1.p1  ORF type:complete len:182 (+),score=34.73 TRINITY_DN1332_c0_g1_i1:28-573(+)